MRAHLVKEYKHWCIKMERMMYRDDISPTSYGASARDLKGSLDSSEDLKNRVFETNERH
jgi:hypothetical protein